MEAAITRVKSSALARNAAITITFGVLFYAICALTPTLSKSIVGPFELTFRFAQILRPFVFWLGPAVPVGIAFGSSAFNGSVGEVT